MRSCVPSVLGWLALASLAASVPAQTCKSEYDVLYGGYEHWVGLRQSSAGDFQAWTTGGGGRIRVLNTDPQYALGWSLQVFDASGGNGPDHYDQIVRSMDVYEQQDGDVVGIAVGDEGQWAWCEEAQRPGACWVAEPRIQDGAGAHPDLWDIAFHLNAAGMLDPGSLMYVVGRGGYLGRKALGNSGHSWGSQNVSRVDLGTTQDLLGIDIRAGRGIVVGASGRVYYNLDVTQSTGWTAASMPILPYGLALYAVAFDPSAPNVAYAVGGVGVGSGHVYRSVDYGASWSPEAVLQSPSPCAAKVLPCTNEIVTGSTTQGGIGTQYDVTVFDDGTALAVGYGGSVLQRPIVTGQWNDVSDLCQHGSGPLWSVDSAAGNLALLTGLFGTLRQSNDQGSTWSDVKDPVPYRLKDVASPPDAGSTPGEVVFIVGAQRFIGRSLDGGQTWTEMHKQAGSVPNFTSIACSPDGVHAVAVGDGLIGSYTTDGLSTSGSCVWQPASGLPASSEIFNEVAYAGINGAGQPEFWAVGTGNSVYRSADGGATWVASPPPGTSNVSWEGVSFLESERGVLVGRDGPNGVAHAYVFGSWIQLHSGTPAAFYGVHLAGNRGFAVGKDAVYEIVNGKFTTSMTIPPLNVPAGLRLSEVRILNVAPVELVVAGDDGHLWTYEGGTWTRRHSLTSNHFRGIDYPSRDRGFLMGATTPEAPSTPPVSAGSVPFGQSTLVGFVRGSGL